MIGCTHSAPSLTGRAGGESWGCPVTPLRYVLAPVAVLSGAGARTPVSLISFAKILLFRAATKTGVWLMCENLLRNGRIGEKFAGGWLR